MWVKAHSNKVKNQLQAGQETNSSQPLCLFYFFVLCRKRWRAERKLKRFNSHLWTPPGPVLPAHWRSCRPSPTGGRAAPGTPPRFETWTPWLPGNTSKWVVLPLVVPARITTGEAGGDWGCKRSDCRSLCVEAKIKRGSITLSSQWWSSGISIVAHLCFNFHQ